LRLFVLTLSRLIVMIVGTARRFAWPTVIVLLALAVAGLAYSAHHLRLDSDTDALFARSLPWRQAQIRESRDFPQFDNLLVAVVQAKTPEEARETASALNAALNADKAHFRDSRYPAGSAFYAQQGLLLLPTDQLTKLLTSIIAAQPFLGQLAADPSARGLFTGLSLIAQGVSTGANLTPYRSALEGVQQNLAAAAAGHPEPLSWQSLITGGVGMQDTEFVLTHPRLDQGALEPGGVATAALVRIAASLPDVKAGRATVNYTGQVPLADEQFASLTQGLVVGGIISVLLIALWLFLALRSWRLIMPILATLLLGLALTVSFTAVFIGVINLISVAFAILFIGLAVDFAIQFCVRLRDVRHGVTDLARAIPETARQAGGQIALAATATACGFFAFSPTPFVGVAELGVIAGAGMFIALLCTITFLPALLWLFRPGTEALPVGLSFGAPLDRALQRRRRPVLLVFAVLAMAGVASAATISFDANPLDTKDPHSESMRTLLRLIANPTTNPFYAEALAPNLDAARALQARLGALPEVAGTLSGATFVPEQQAQKLAMLEQVKSILAPTLLAADSPPPAVTASSIRAAMAKAHDGIMQVAKQLPPDSPLLGIAAVLGQLQTASDAEVLAMNAAVTRFLPDELQRLGSSLSPQPITMANLPKGIAADWFLPDGQVRVEAFPTEAAQTSAGLNRFAKAVLEIAPDAGGPAISTVATAQTILHSFREAAFLAFVAIALILVAVFRNLRDTLLVLATLTLSALLTALFAKLWGLSINYANIIALPLLLGVGVSFNVYFVMNFRAGMRKFLSSATAQAVLFSALTTSTAFGSLAASHDRGTASMGILLLLSLVAVLIATFIFLPALLYTLSAQADRRATLPERNAREA
jgi:hopanoid biosynthesis associated RND transporter like protein HpnN